MDGRGGCCIARYAGGAYDMSKVDRIMLRFRPIAPKPSTTNGSGSGNSSPEMSDVSPKSGRGKRRYSNGNSKRSSNGSSGSSRKRKAVQLVSREEKKVDSVITTLPLLPETPEPLSTKQAKKAPTWLSFGCDVTDQDQITLSTDRTVVMAPHAKSVMASCVTVECVTDTWVDVGGLGSTDEERRKNLERDTCPGMISDGYGRVTWTNEGYRKMVVGGGGGGGQVAVWLVMKEERVVVGEFQRAFTCKVRVQNQNTCGLRSSITVPCDAWRMDNGGFAWRLDVNAALSLGR